MAFLHDVQHLKSGLVIYRRADVKHENWYCRIRIAGQRRYKPISLKTTDITLAKERAFEHEAELRFKAKHGLPVFSQKFSALAEKYLQHVRDRADTGQISSFRCKTVASYINKHLIPYLGDRDVTTLSDTDWTSYPAWRVRSGKGRSGKRMASSTSGTRVTNSTINSEMIVLRAIVRFGQSAKLIPPGEVFKSRVVLSNERREAFSFEEYRQLHTFARGWIKKTANPVTAWFRNATYLFILVMSNTGMRTSEARNLRWSDISTRTDKSGRHYTILKVRGKGKHRHLVAPENVKTYLDRIRDASKANGANDCVFSNADGSPCTTLYRAGIRNLLKVSGLLVGPEGSERSTYCFRHTYATFRLTEGVDSLFLAKQMGTSVAMIEKHYGHITPVKNAERILQGMPDWEALPDTEQE